MKRLLLVGIAAFILTAAICGPVLAAGKPDLVISDIVHCYWQKGPGFFIFSGYVLCVEVTMMNQGDVLSGPTHLEAFLYVDFTDSGITDLEIPFTLSYMLYVAPLAPGADTSVVLFNFPLFGPPGQEPTGEFPPHFFILTVDPHERIDESNEDNNVEKLTLMLANNPCSECEEERCSESEI